MHHDLCDFQVQFSLELSSAIGGFLFAILTILKLLGLTQRILKEAVVAEQLGRLGKMHQNCKSLPLLLYNKTYAAVPSILSVLVSLPYIYLFTSQ